MRKKIISIATILILSAGMCGCGNADSGTGTETPKEAEATDDNVAKTSDSSKQEDTASTNNEGTGKHYEYEVVDSYDGEEGGTPTSYVRKYDLNITDDGSATLSETYEYTDTYHCTYSYKGNATMEDPGIIFIMEPTNEDSYGQVYYFTLSEDEITQVESSGYEPTIQALYGSYTGEDEELGGLVLEIAKSGNATLTTNDNKVLKGSILLLDDKFDLMVSDDNTSVDWFVSFDGDTFTHESYYNTSYAGYEGTYQIHGMLGEITLVVDSQGEATADVTIDDMVISMRGSINTDMDAKKLTGVYLYSDEGYTLDLSLMYLDQDGFWNYSGYLTTPLAAG